MVSLSITTNTGRRFSVLGFSTEQDAEKKAKLFAKFGVPDVRDGQYTHWRPWQIKAMILTDGKDGA